MLVLADLASYRILLECDGQILDGLDSQAVLVANVRTNAGRIVVASSALPRDGLMNVISIRNGTVLDLVAIVAIAILAEYPASEQVIHRQVKQMKLRSEPGVYRSATRF